MRVLVLGGYGLIGLEVVRTLRRHGHDVTGLARSEGRGRRMLPEARWLGADLSSLTEPAAWAPHLANIEAVVNASGALQDSGRDNLLASQQHAIAALIAACEQHDVQTFVQISAPGASRSADTAFLRTKGEADEVLSASQLRWTILKPGLVIGPTAYGGTSLLRMLAGFPVVQPLICPGSRIQTVAVDEVAEAVARVLTDPNLSGRAFDLVEDEAQSLEDLVAQFRKWLGFPPAKLILKLSNAVGYALAAAADAAGWLGWRSSLRTTALKVLAHDVTGDPAPWTAATGETLSPLQDTLARLPATLQERHFARTRLVFPLLLLTLAVFWIVSGAVGFIRQEAAIEVIADRLPMMAAKIAVLGGSALDILIGVGVLFRSTLSTACWGAILISIVYLILGTLLTPHLWADPLGAFVKILPAIALALAVLAMGEER